MGWIGFLLILALMLAGVGFAVEAFRWLLLIALVVLLTSALIGWSRRNVV